jgi:hypothetical protein
MKATSVILQGLLLGIAAAEPTVFLIRHGEKPASGNGLNIQGEQRAQCLRSVFGAGSGYNIGYIMVQKPPSGEIIHTLSAISAKNRKTAPSSGHMTQSNRLLATWV